MGCYFCHEKDAAAVLRLCILQGRTNKALGLVAQGRSLMAVSLMIMARLAYYSLLAINIIE